MDAVHCFRIKCYKNVNYLYLPLSKIFLIVDRKHRYPGVSVRNNRQTNPYGRRGVKSYVPIMLLPLHENDLMTSLTVTILIFEVAEAARPSINAQSNYILSINRKQITPLRTSTDLLTASHGLDRKSRNHNKHIIVT